MHQFRPSGVPDPQPAAALPAKVALARAGFPGAGFVVGVHGTETAHVLLALYVQGVEAGADIDDRTGTALGFSTDGAVSSDTKCFTI